MVSLLPLGAVAWVAALLTLSTHADTATDLQNLSPDDSHLNRGTSPSTTHLERESYLHPDRHRRPPSEEIAVPKRDRSLYPNHLDRDVLPHVSLLQRILSRDAGFLTGDVFSDLGRLRQDSSHLKGSVFPGPRYLKEDVSSGPGQLKRDLSPDLSYLKKRDLSPDLSYLMKQDLSPDLSHLKKRELSPDLSHLNIQDLSPYLNHLKERNLSPVLGFLKRDLSSYIRHVKRDLWPDLNHINERNHYSDLSHLNERDLSPDLNHPQRGVSPDLSHLKERDHLSPDLSHPQRGVSPDLSRLHARDLSPDLSSLSTRDLPPEVFAPSVRQEAGGGPQPRAALSSSSSSPSFRSELSSLETRDADPVGPPQPPSASSSPPSQTLGRRQVVVPYPAGPVSAGPVHAVPVVYAAAPMRPAYSAYILPQSEGLVYWPYGAGVVPTDKYSPIEHEGKERLEKLAEQMEENKKTMISELSQLKKDVQELHHLKREIDRISGHLIHGITEYEKGSTKSRRSSGLAALNRKELKELKKKIHEQDKRLEKLRQVPSEHKISSRETALTQSAASVQVQERDVSLQQHVKQLQQQATDLRSVARQLLQRSESLRRLHGNQTPENVAQVKRDSGEVDGRRESQAAPKPAFFVQFAEGGRGSLKTGDSGAVKFSQVVTNVGDGYNATSGHFTAPSAGSYDFFLSLRSADGSGQLGLFRGGNDTASVVVDIWGGGGPGNAAGSAIVGLRKGERVFVKESRNGSAEAVTYAAFSGHLI